MLSTGIIPVFGPRPESIHHRPPFTHTAVVGMFTQGTGHVCKAGRFGVGRAGGGRRTGFSLVPSPTISRSSLSAIARIADNDIWAVGNAQPFNSGGDVTLAEHFNGTSWTTVATPNPGPNGATLNGVAAAATNNVWAIGSTVSSNSLGEVVASPLIEHFNGTAWSVVASPRPRAAASSVA